MSFSFRISPAGSSEGARSSRPEISTISPSYSSASLLSVELMSVKVVSGGVIFDKIKLAVYKDNSSDYNHSKYRQDD